MSRGQNSINLYFPPPPPPSKNHLLNFRTSRSKSVQSYCPSMKMIARDIFVNKFPNNFLQ